MEDKETIKILVCALFNEWAENVSPEDRDTETLEYFCKNTGAQARSPLVMMFEAFEAGLFKGMDLMRKLQEKEEEEDPAEAFSLEEQERDEEAYFSAFGDDLLVVEERQGADNEA